MFQNERLLESKILHFIWRKSEKWETERRKSEREESKEIIAKNNTRQRGYSEQILSEMHTELKTHQTKSTPN